MRGRPPSLTCSFPRWCHRCFQLCLLCHSTILHSSFQVLSCSVFLNKTLVLICLDERHEDLTTSLGPDPSICPRETAGRQSPAPRSWAGTRVYKPPSESESLPVPTPFYRNCLAVAFATASQFGSVTILSMSDLPRNDVMNATQPSNGRSCLCLRRRTLVASSAKLSTAGNAIQCPRVIKTSEPEHCAKNAWLSRRTVLNG